MRVGKPRKFSWVVGSALLPLALLAAACGDDDGDDDAATEEGGDGGGGGGTLTVCSDIPYEPFEFEDEDGEITGFDIEIMREVGRRLDREVEVTDQPFEGIWLAPRAGTCDIVASAMTITPEREEEALFTDPYFDADQSLLVRAEDEDTYATLDDLAGQTIGVQTDTTGEDYANENAPEGARVEGFPDAGALFLALESGDIAAILQDLPVNGYRAQQDDSMVVTETFPTGEQYGFAADQDNQELIDDVNEQLAAMHDDGTYDAIYEEWFGEVPDSGSSGGDSDETDETTETTAESGS
jgi:polar amino acid transport system substrate-binding protein